MLNYFKTDTQKGQKVRNYSSDHLTLEFKMAARWSEKLILILSKTTVELKFQIRDKLTEIEGVQENPR